MYHKINLALFKLRLIIVGFGVVGQSFARLILSRAADLYSTYGVNPRVVACIDKRGVVACPSGIDLQKLLDIKKIKGTVGAYKSERSKWTEKDIVEQIDSEVLLELTPTNLQDGEPGISNIVSAMRSGKHVITVNKGPLALAFPSLMELASYNNVMLRFSGTVGGGTPILEFAKRCLKGDSILSFKGILNGTTNYILTKMEEGLSFESALRDAQKKGIAEAIPELDIDGYDAAAKVSIIANWIMGMKKTICDVERTGIAGVNLKDIEEARKRNNAIKLVGMVENKKLIVRPIQVSKFDPICVNGTLNAVTFSSEHSGQHTIIGLGAGGMETASSVLRDLIEIKNTTYNI
jgi:homoserine dehydrogenase